MLPGVRGREDLQRVLGFLTVPSAQRDYSFTPKEHAGTCVYCNHCQPCPVGLDVGLINKYYDLSLARNILAKNHYANLHQRPLIVFSVGAAILAAHSM